MSGYNILYLSMKENRSILNNGGLSGGKIRHQISMSIPRVFGTRYPGPTEVSTVLSSVLERRRDPGGSSGVGRVIEGESELKIDYGHQRKLTFSVRVPQVSPERFTGRR